MLRLTHASADTEASPADVAPRGPIQLEKRRPNGIQQHGRRALLDLTERASQHLDDMLAKGRRSFTIYLDEDDPKAPDWRALRFTLDRPTWTYEGQTPTRVVDEDLIGLLRKRAGPGFPEASAFTAFVDRVTSLGGCVQLDNAYPWDDFPTYSDPVKGRLFVTLDREAFERRLRKQRGRAAERRRFEEPRWWKEAPTPTDEDTVIPLITAAILLALVLLHGFLVL